MCRRRRLRARRLLRREKVRQRRGVHFRRGFWVALGGGSLGGGGSFGGGGVPGLSVWGRGQGGLIIIISLLLVGTARAPRFSFLLVRSLLAIFLARILRASERRAPAPGLPRGPPAARGAGAPLCWGDRELLLLPQGRSGSGRRLPPAGSAAALLAAPLWPALVRSGRALLSTTLFCAPRRAHVALLVCAL